MVNMVRQIQGKSGATQRLINRSPQIEPKGIRAQGRVLLRIPTDKFHQIDHHPSLRTAEFY